MMCHLCCNEFRMDQNKKNPQYCKLRRGEYICDLCDKTSKPIHNIANLRSDYPSREKKKCNICNELFSTKRKYETHLKKVHKDIIFYCDICKKSLKSKDYYIKHIKRHDKNYFPPSFPCTQCDRTFLTKHGLRNHQKLKHESIKLNICETCGRNFSSRESLKDHILLHSGEKPIVCGICGTSFRKKTSLKVHMLTHTKERPYGCKDCGKTFTQWSSLQIHTRKFHTGEKPYICVVCDESFVTLTLLKSHAKTHGILPENISSHRKIQNKT